MAFRWPLGVGYNQADFDATGFSMGRTMRRMVLLLLTVLIASGAGQASGDDADDAFFESKVRPLLIAKCYECHGSEKPKSGLRMDSRDAILAGGESGPAAVSGKPAESMLMDVIGYRNTIQMPPKAKLAESEIATLTEWVKRGLPWPNSKPSAPASPAASSSTMEFTDEQKGFWAFQPVKPVTPPVTQRSSSARSPVDSFILASLEAAGLGMAPEANRRTLLRRVTIDLTGLLPTPDEVTEFLNDPAPDAFERVVDRLLASPRYGERWARHWLDVARYADSNGLDENLAYANAFHYRDYVVQAFRADKPYDRFLIEQIAGDLLFASESSAGAQPGDSFDPLIATGFLCLGAKMLAEDDPVKMNMDIIDEQVDTIARAVMGLTMGCARCHDHKFDPLSTEDYYGLAGVFKSTQTMDTFTVVARWHERPLAFPEQLRQRDQLQQLATSQKQAIEKLKGDATELILSEARRQPGAYLLAATREMESAERLKTAQPRGNDRNPQAIAGAILIEAEDYLRGNVLKDRETYGKEIGVLVNRGETPNFTEYDFQVERASTYQLELRYAAAASRPVKVFVNGQLVKRDAASKVTGTWHPDSQTWFVECHVPLKAGSNTVRLEQPQFFPHIDKLLLTPAEASLVPANDGDASLRLIPSLVAQWSALLQQSKGDSKSILTSWHLFVSGQPLVADTAHPGNGIGRLCGERPPESLMELAARYDKLFAEAADAWKTLKGTEAGKDTVALPDPVLEAARMLASDPKGPFAIPADLESYFPDETVRQLKSAREELARREAAIPRFTEVMAVAEAKPEALKIHLRGNHLTLGREVPRQLPRILAGAGPRELTEGSGRLELARWLASPQHPLTARVMANRIWQWHFGQGLVRSPDNFGRLGERPSHPALLDWLAAEFSGMTASQDRHPRSYSMKSLHRLLIGSAAYRQSTEYNAAAALADPEDRLLWRFHRQRMDVEVLRDSLLAISGRLDETPGGSMLPTANRAYVTSTANVNPAIYQSNRRSIYLPVVRSALYEVFTAFDFADPSTLAGQRDQTTVAPQALFMMNSEIVYEQSKLLAGQMRDRQDLDVRGRIRHLYALSYSRDASEGEISRASGYLDRIRTAFIQSGVDPADADLRAWTSFCRALLSANEFVYVE